MKIVGAGGAASAVQHLDGELVVLDGQAFVAHADGRVDEVGLATKTPFVVACRFVAAATRHVDRALPLDELCAALDDLSPAGEPVVAVRVDGHFRDVRLRSVHAQRKPYPPLAEVVAHQTEWTVPEATGTVVGFRFPAGIRLGEPGALAEEIHAVEGGAGS
jgi:acetolactate decarboxylase